VLLFLDVRGFQELMLGWDLTQGLSKKLGYYFTEALGAK